MSKVVRYFACFSILLQLQFGCECGYIGCYGDNDGNRDLNDVISDDEQASDVDDAAATDVMTVDACIEQCRANGSPYAGLQAGSTCHCGQTYGRYGPATNCNYTCSGECGGIDANSVYYVTNTASDAARQHWAYDTRATFVGARRNCIESDGDLASFSNDYNFTAQRQLFDDLSVTENVFWLGLRSIFIPECSASDCQGSNPVCNDTQCNAPTERVCSDYDWVNYDVSVNAPFNDSCANSGVTPVWQDDESWQNECVVVNMTSGLLQTTNCFAQNAFLCFSLTDAEIPTFDDAAVTVKADNDEVDLKTTRLALFIVLPIFFCCYGGSMIAYCLHRIHRSCKKLRRSRRKRMEAQREESFSAVVIDVKPKQPAPPPPPFSTSTGSQSLLAKVLQQMNEKAKQQVPSYYEKTKMVDLVRKARMEKRRQEVLEKSMADARARQEEDDTMPDGDVDEVQRLPTDSDDVTTNAASKWKQGAGELKATGNKVTFDESLDIDDVTADDEKAALTENAAGNGVSSLASIAAVLKAKKAITQKPRRLRKIVSS